MSLRNKPIEPPSYRPLAESAPVLRGDLRVVPQRDRSGELWMRVEVPEQGRFLRVGLLEYELLSRLDGRRSVDAARTEAIVAYQSMPGRQSRQLMIAQAESVVLWANQEGLLKSTQREAETPQKRQRSSLLWVRIPLTRGGYKLDCLTRSCRWIFSPWSGMLALMLWLMAAAVVFSDWQRFLSDAGTIFTPTGWVRLAAVWVVLKILHELGHAVCCRRFGGRVGQIGIAWMLVAPVAFVDLTDAYRIRSRWRRMMVSLAGVYVELTLAAVAAVLWSQSASPPLCHLLTTIILTAGVGSALFNLNPLMRLDGYFVLTDWIGRPNLSADAKKAVNEYAAWWFLGRRLGRAATGEPRTGLLLYGIAAALYRFSILGGLLLAGIQMYGRAGLLLAGIVVISWLCRPVAQAIRAARDVIAVRPAAAIRMLLSTGTIGAILASLLFIPRDDYLGTKPGWPGIVVFEHETPLRNAPPGFLREIYVQDGQWVSQGMPIVRLENLVLRAQRSAVEHELAMARVVERKHRELKATGPAVAQANSVRALEKRLRELQDEEASLTVYAPRDGLVVAPRLEHWQDRWLEAGEAVCHLVQPQHMKAIVAIPQHESNEFRAIAQQALLVDCGKAAQCVGTIGTVPHHASLKPPHPAMAASAGGSLATRPLPQDEDRLSELLVPHLRVEVQIQDPPAWLKAGQPVRVYHGDSLY